MAWKYIEYRYPTEYQFEKLITWADSNFRCYFALKEKYSESWQYFSGEADHTLATGEKLVSRTTEGDAQTNYWLAQPDSNNKTIALLPTNSLYRYVRIYIDDANDAPTQIYEFRPSARITADEIVTGDLKITDQFSSPPTITVTASNIDRVKIGKVSNSYGIVGYDNTSATIFELTDNTKQIAGWDFTSTQFAKNNAYISSSGKVKLGSGNDVVEMDSQDANYRLWVGHDNAASAPFRVTKEGNLTANAGVFNGTLAASSINTRELAGLSVNNGILDAEAVTTAKLAANSVTAAKISVASLEALAINTGHLVVNASIGVGAGLLIDGVQNRIRAESGSNYVEMTASWLKGYDSVLGQTFILPTDGSTPEFSSGKIKEVEYIVWNAGVLKIGSGSSEASIQPATSGGLIANNESMTGYNQNGNKRFQVIYAGTDQGDVEIGDYAGNLGAKWDQSEGTFTIKGNVVIRSGSGIASLADAGNLAVENTVTAALISANAVEASHIKSSAITTDKLAAYAVDAGKITANAVEASTIKASAITTDKLALQAITAVKMAADSIEASHIKAGAVVLGSATGDLDDITDGTTYGKVKAVAIDSGHINLIRRNATTFNRLEITASGMEAYEGGTKVFDLVSGNIYLGDQTENYIHLSNTGMDIKNRDEVVASFKAMTSFASDPGELVLVDSYSDHSVDGSYYLNAVQIGAYLVVAVVSGDGLTSFSITGGGDIEEVDTLAAYQSGAIATDGNYIYHSITTDLRSIEIDSDGQMTLVDNETLSDDVDSVEAGDGWVFVSSASGVMVYSVDGSGQLTYESIASLSGITSVGRMYWDGEFLHVPINSVGAHRLHSYSIDANGTLTLEDSHSLSAAPKCAVGTGNYVYVTDGYYIDELSVDGNGDYTAIGTHLVHGTYYPQDLTCDGVCVYAATYYGYVYSFLIGSDGSLSDKDSIDTGINASASHFITTFDDFIVSTPYKISSPSDAGIFLYYAKRGTANIGNSFSLKTGASITEISTDGTMAGDSDNAVPTEKAVKTYVDGKFVQIKTGTYTGDGTTSQSITGVGFRPKYVRIFMHPTAEGYNYSFTKLDQDWSVYSLEGYEWEYYQTDRLVSLDSDGFTVDDEGTDKHPNLDGQVYDYIAFG